MSRHRQSGGLVLRMRARVLAAVVATLAALALPVAPAGATVATVPPRITGVAAVGQTVSAEPGTWDTEGLTLVHTWFLDGVAVADGPEYTPGPADQGHGLSIRETALQDGAPVGEATSDPVTVLGPAPVATTAPDVTGPSHVGDVLQASAGTWSRPDLSFTYQWLRDGVPIADATASSYAVTGEDWCRDLAVVVTASEEGYAEGVAASPTFRTSCLIVECFLPTAVELHLVRQVVTPRQHPVLKVRILIAADRAPESGRVMVRVQRGRIKTVHLRAADHGRLTIRLPRQQVGRHPVHARYDAPPNTCLMDSQTATLLRVRARH